MNNPEERYRNGDDELPDSWWRKVYTAVLLSAVIVILLLAAFSRYFSD
ncbi:MAG TPA: hypothetical protein PKD24_15835 [Pyrinomonadaceae bacterium]|nr:hypothetical protein [Pyrinomonadaceae bacterium]HMP66877.1 hypothetical protein [Pyrinomonadaceae bacterium]